MRLSAFTLVGFFFVSLPWDAAAVSSPSVVSSRHSPSSSFKAWVVQLKAQAGSQGISAQTLQALDTVIYNPQVISLDRKQPEGVLPLNTYMNRRLKHLKKPARRHYQQHSRLLKSAEERFSVPAEYIVALWGIESHFGKNMGGLNVLNSLATLAFEGRRAHLFLSELMTLLRLIDGHRFPKGKALKGSWAGAMGQCQFMPSSYEQKAVDGDGDGLADIWHSLSDVFSSIANYLHQEGWHKDERWGRPVSLPKNFDPQWVTLDSTQTVNTWRKRGIQSIDGKALPASTLQASLIRPDGTGKGQAFLVYDNFRILMKWNQSQRFAITVGTLAESIKSR